MRTVVPPGGSRSSEARVGVEAGPVATGHGREARKALGPARRAGQESGARLRGRDAAVVSCPCPCPSPRNRRATARTLLPCVAVFVTVGAVVAPGRLLAQTAAGGEKDRQPVRMQVQVGFSPNGAVYPAWVPVAVELESRQASLRGARLVARVLEAACDLCGQRDCPVALVFRDDADAHRPVLAPGVV